MKLFLKAENQQTYISLHRNYSGGAFSYPKFLCDTHQREYPYCVCKYNKAVS